MWVVKIGGSLYDAPELKEWLDAIATHGGGRVVIVPGGGPFANQVRAAQMRWGFTDLDAHLMALHAMEQFGRMLIAIERRLVAARIEPEIKGAVARKQVPVWFAATMVEEEESIDETWSITSDSLAAWLATRLGATHLALVKSIEPRPGHPDAATVAEQGIVDRRFPQFAGASGYRTWWLGRSE